MFEDVSGVFSAMAPSPVVAVAEEGGQRNG
jgi:hypothetical protein